MKVHKIVRSKNVLCCCFQGYNDGLIVFTKLIIDSPALIIRYQQHSQTPIRKSAFFHIEEMVSLYGSGTKYAAEHLKEQSNHKYFIFFFYEWKRGGKVIWVQGGQFTLNLNSFEPRNCIKITSFD